MNRNNSLQNIINTECWDIVVIGGGATGLGTAVDAASRGYKTLLVEQADFAKGTSSRSTKLVHGGVRYLEQGNISLVKEALKERGLFLQNAPHLARQQAFIVPVYSFWERLKYTIGLKLYEWLSGNLRIGKVAFLSKEKVINQMPGISSKKLKGGVLYYDGQFDDARMALSLAATCEDFGGTVINYMKVESINRNEKNQVDGVTLEDLTTNKRYNVQTKVVINATGVFADDVREMDTGKRKKTILPSQGVHLVLDSKYLQTLDCAMMIPKTDDGRVLFLVPWHNHLLMGTTDTALEEHTLEPRALDTEIDFILRNARQYLAVAPKRSDVLSIYAGLRPLALPEHGNGENSKDISRGESIKVSNSNLISVTGGKWTTYRHMGEDTINKAIEVGNLNPVACKTSSLKIHGWKKSNGEGADWDVYGSDREKIEELVKQDPGLGKRVDKKWNFIEAEVVWAVREEMAIQLEDVLSRRFRVLFLDARAAMKMAPRVAAIMRRELGTDEYWEKDQLARFEELAKGYVL